MARGRAESLGGADAGRPAVPAGLVADLRSLRSALRTDGGAFYWVENRPHRGGRQVVVRARPGGRAEEVDTGGHSVRSGVHGYGGGAFCLVGMGDGSPGAVAFVDQSDQRIYLLAAGEGPAEPVALTEEPPPGERWCHGDLWACPDGHVVLAVRERYDARGRPQRQLIAVGVPPAPQATPGPPAVLWEGSDFVAAPRFGSPTPGGRRLAWVTWDHPDMPWDATTLWAGVLETADPSGPVITAPERVAGGPSESVGSPAWTEDGALVFVSDREGWWQPYRAEPGAPARRACDLEADFHTPDWQLAQTSLAPLKGPDVACRWRAEGRDHLGVLDTSTGTLGRLDQPCVTVSALVAGPDGLAWLGATPWSTTAVWWWPRKEGGAPEEGRGAEVVHPSDPEPLGRQVVSVARPLEVGGERPVPALFYPPRPEGRAGKAPPLVVHCHGGPTGQADPGLDPTVQYFTSRGFAVAVVDYRGSSGHGRAWRRALEGAWGVADVEDCVAVARWLAERGEVDGGRMAIRGGSAGGLTALLALRAPSAFAAATSWYGVTDLVALAETTHDFEAHYTDRLVGPLPAAAATYRARSPRWLASELEGAVLVLQGLEDSVVPPSQASALVDELRRLGHRCEYLTFPGEGHGFRQAQSTIRGLEAEAAFYREVLGLGWLEV